MAILLQMVVVEGWPLWGIPLQVSNFNTQQHIYTTTEVFHCAIIGRCALWKPWYLCYLIVNDEKIIRLKVWVSYFAPHDFTPVTLETSGAFGSRPCPLSRRWGRDFGRRQEKKRKPHISYKALDGCTSRKCSVYPEGSDDISIHTSVSTKLDFPLAYLNTSYIITIR